MHDGKHGLHPERMCDAEGEPTDLWALVDYGSPHHATAPWPRLVMSREAFWQLAGDILALERVARGGEPRELHPMDRRRHEPSEPPVWVQRALHLEEVSRDVECCDNQRLILSTANEGRFYCAECGAYWQPDGTPVPGSPLHAANRGVRAPLGEPVGVEDVGDPVDDSGARGLGS